jgi:hypothetical protein
MGTLHLLCVSATETGQEIELHSAANDRLTLLSLARLADSLSKEIGAVKISGGHLPHHPEREPVVFEKGFGDKAILRPAMAEIFRLRKLRRQEIRQGKTKPFDSAPRSCTLLLFCVICETCG